MIYVEENEFSRQIDLLNYVAGLESLSVCAWLYPESEVNTLAGFRVMENIADLESVTSYVDGFIPRHTELVAASPEHLNAFFSSVSELRDNCDSLTLYQTGSPYWLVATIGHEGICLLKDESLLGDLVGAGFKASTEPPSWW